MNKELESLKDLKSIILCQMQDAKTLEIEYKRVYDIYKDKVDIIETALKEKEELEKMFDNDEKLINKLNKENNCQEQILRIIKEKDVNVFYLKNSNSAEEYNIGLDLPRAWQLTQEEYNLLKEELTDEK